jgi:uncharacterized membrane protein
MQYLAATPGVAERDSLVERILERLNATYERVMALPNADTVLIVGMFVYACLAIVGVVAVIVLQPEGGSTETFAAARIAQVGSTLVGAVLIGRGILALRTSRIDAYRWFLRGLLVWILITQVFVFYSSQLGGLAGLAVDLFAYWSLQYATGRELAVAAHTQHAGQQSGPSG